jgi:hypothetical protein
MTESDLGLALARVASAAAVPQGRVYAFLLGARVSTESSARIAAALAAIGAHYEKGKVHVR